jgi:hypothetical protein
MQNATLIDLGEAEYHLEISAKKGSKNEKNKK